MRHHAGFTLIDMLVAMAVILILMALAYPAYGGFITRTRRTEGQSALVEAMQQQERYYTRHNSYIAFSSESTTPEELAFKWWSGTTPEDSAYELRAEACPGQTLVQCVQVRAMPGTGKVDAGFEDPECEVLAVTSTGTMTSSGTSPRCWP